MCEAPLGPSRHKVPDPFIPLFPVWVCPFAQKRRPNSALIEVSLIAGILNYMFMYVVQNSRQYSIPLLLQSPSPAQITIVRGTKRNNT